MREKNIKKPKRVANWGKKTLVVSVLVVAPDSGIATFAVIVRLVRVMILLVGIPRMHIKNSRGRQDGLGWGRRCLGGVSVSELCVGGLGGEQMCGRGCRC